MSCSAGGCAPRRDFLKATALSGAALALAACGGGGSEDPDAERLWTDVAPEENLPAGEAGVAEVGDRMLLVYRPDEESVMVFSSVCPHEGCAVGMDGEHFECPCHGSQFEFTGERIAGPAQEDLTSYEAEITEGMIRARL
ncbi:QcrA and Rieske domain-containing protein [Nesterenkonia populi]|uniref:QcrA and Rieske domain-containing protein n=1 Tax=Nesterenkonia populi TaxID=1591087 RepID=UPI0011BFA6EF|nr:Rieske (2Fe-2S) protein [Nesterenkonia populi]